LFFGLQRPKFRVLKTANRVKHYQINGFLGEQLFFNALHIGFVHSCERSQITLTLGRFLGQDVTFESVLTLNLPGTGELKALFRA
jgi:hypothetical protein